MNNLLENSTVNKVEFANILRGPHTALPYSDKIPIKLLGQNYFVIPKLPSIKNTPKYRFHVKKILPFEEEAKKYAESVRAVHKRELNQRSLDMKKEFRLKLNETKYGNIPQIPITLMNSSMVAKRIQILMIINQRRLVNQKQQQSVSQKDNYSLVHHKKSIILQKSAVKDIIEDFGNQINGRIQSQQNKKRIVNQIKDMYIKELFVQKGQGINVQNPLSKVVSLPNLVTHNSKRYLIIFIILYLDIRLVQLVHLVQFIWVVLYLHPWTHNNHLNSTNSTTQPIVVTLFLISTQNNEIIVINIIF